MFTINLHFTDFCNFRCKHCFVNKENKELSFENIKIIIDKIVQYKNLHNEEIRINLAGGEPLVSQNIQKIIDYAYDSKLEVSIITNGYYLNQYFVENNKNKLSMIGISVDSINDNTNMKIGRCCNKKTISEKELIDICRIIKDNGIKLKINTCVTSLNRDENISSFLKKVNPDKTKVLRAFCDKNNSQYNISDDEWNIIKEKYENVFFEDNDYMRNHYIIVDSSGNLSRNNLHIDNNSLIDNSLEECLSKAGLLISGKLVVQYENL